ncbi:MAG TPA: SagB family peptide dehydrogenase [Methylovirgula sp.]
MRTPGPKKVRRSGGATIVARLRPRVLLEAYGNGEAVARFEGESVSFGMFGKGVAGFIHDLHTGVPVDSVSANKKDNKEAALLLRRLAQSGILEYALTEKGKDLVVIEPQLSHYWPQKADTKASDTLILSRFAYLHRRGDEIVIESPLSSALFRFRDPKIAATLAMLSVPQKAAALGQKDDATAVLLGLLLEAGILLKVAAGEKRPPRLAEGDANLAFWDFHDLLFHARSTEGRHVNPVGGVYPFQGFFPALPAVRPSWPGKKIDLKANKEPHRGAAKIFRERHSVRSFDSGRPITLAELSEFLDGAAHNLTGPVGDPGIDDGGHVTRPYPCAGASHELELYLAVDQCEGLMRGFYHYDAAAHALVPIEVAAAEFDAVFAGAQSAMGAPARPQIVIVIAARFGRVAWKYSALAYSLILKNVGVLTQTLYLMASDMGLGGCAAGLSNIDLFEKMTGIPFHVEGPVGQFALGRPSALSR